MKLIYSKIWNLAKPFYKKGRAMDIEHIKWMMKDAEFVCKKEKLDDSLLLPLVIIHDVGYAGIKGNSFNKNLRKTHMKAGAIIAENILEKVKYPKQKIKKIVKYVSIHDNWAFGQNSIYKDKILGTFNDLDFIWMATPKGFPALRKILKKNKKEMIDYIRNDDKPTKIPFKNKTTKLLFKKYLENLSR